MRHTARATGVVTMPIEATAWECTCSECGCVVRSNDDGSRRAFAERLEGEGWYFSGCITLGAFDSLYSYCPECMAKDADANAAPGETGEGGSSD